MSEQMPSIKWAVVHEIPSGLNKTQIAEFFVTEVDPEATMQYVKDTLDDAGLFFGESGVRWEKYFLSPEADWAGDGTPFLIGSQNEEVSFTELLARSKTDRRITLRLSPAMHAGLAHAAQGRGISLNQIIVDVLDDWQVRHNDVRTSGSLADLGSQAASAAFEKVEKQYSFSVTQLAAYPIFFVELLPRELQTALSPNASPRQMPPPKAIVEFRDCAVMGTTLIGKEAKFVKWERPVPSGKFGDGELRLALEEAVERFERGEL